MARDWGEEEGGRGSTFWPEGSDHTNCGQEALTSEGSGQEVVFITGVDHETVTGIWVTRIDIVPAG